MRPFILSAALLFAGTAVAADGQLDPGFVTDAEYPGYGFYINPNGTPDNTLDSVGAIVERADKKIWVVGRMRAPGAYRLSLYLVQPDGYPDVAFADSGLRTVVAPCADFAVADATLDAQQRLVVVIEGCPDFTVYRFLPSGDLDPGLSGSGVLTVPFNQGGSNNDRSQTIVTTEDSSIILAGTVATATTAVLGIAHFTAAGLPVPGFGIAGKMQVPFEWSVPDVRGVNGLHRMRDGRIVVTGAISETSQAVSDKKQFVVRMLANGVMDPSFGNTSPGISKVNLRTSLGVVQSPWTSASMLENDGRVIQVGSVKSNNVNSSTDFFLLRWRADGQVDTGIGAFGVRQYALDFAGPNPSEPAENSEFADVIKRQGDGKYVIAGSSNQNDYSATAVLRLKRDFSIDTSFGNSGRIQHLVQIAPNGQHGQVSSAMLFQPGRIVAGGVAFTGLNGRMQMMFGMQNDLLFANDFD